MNTANQKISRRDAESAEKTWENKGPDPNSSSTVHNRLPIKGLVVTIVLLISLLVLTFVTGTRSLYVDIVNGNVKRVTKVLGLTYSVKTNETAFSLLVARFGLQDNPDWRLAAQDEMRDVLDSYHTCFNAGTSIVAMDELARLVELNAIDDPSDKIRQLRLLLKGKDTSAVAAYLQEIREQTP